MTARWRCYRSLAVFVQQSPQLAAGSFCLGSNTFAKMMLTFVVFGFFFLLSFLPSPCKTKISQQGSHTGETGRLKSGTDVLTRDFCLCFTFLLHFSNSPEVKTLLGLQWLFVRPPFLKLQRNIIFF